MGGEAGGPDGPDSPPARSAPQEGGNNIAGGECEVMRDGSRNHG
jgi:hypothetical protein